MDNLHEKAKRLIEIDDNLKKDFHSVPFSEKEEHYALGRDGVPYARAYLDTQALLEDALKVMEDIANLSSISEVDTPFAKGFRWGRENTSSAARRFLESIEEGKVSEDR